MNELERDDMLLEEDFLTLEFSDGESEKCLVLGVFEVEDKEYIALSPIEHEDDVYLYGYKEFEDGTFELADMKDNEEYEKVVEMFEKLDAEE